MPSLERWRRLGGNTPGPVRKGKAARTARGRGGGRQKAGSGGGGGGSITVVEVGGGSGLNNQTYNFVETLQQNDVVVVFRGAATYSGTFAMTGYTAVITDTTDNPSAFCDYKRMGASPDTSVTVVDVAGGSQHMPYIVVVLRGVDPTTALDVAVGTGAAATSTLVGFDQVTTVTDGALVFAFANLDTNGANVTTVAFPTGYSLAQRNQSCGGNLGNGIAVSAKIKSPAGAETPGNHQFSNSAANIGYSIAFRPAA